MKDNPLHLNLREYYANSFPAFCEDLLGLQVARHQLEMIDGLMKNRFVCYEAARGHSKSETCAVAYPLWLSFRSIQPLEILISSGTEKQCKNIVRRIQNYCSTVPILQEILIPENYHEGVWSSMQMKTKNGHFIQAHPITSKSIRGNHVNFVICDDLYGEEGEDIETINEAFEKALRPIINLKKGQLVFVGTPVSDKDLFSRIRENPEGTGFHYKAFPAVVLDETGGWKEPQWPEKFSIDELRKIKAGMTSIAWSREYMLEAIADGSRLFPFSLLNKVIDKGCDVRPIDFSAQHYLGCDVAVSDSNRADFSVFITLEKKGGDPARQIDLVRLKGASTDTQLEKIRELHGKYKYSRILIEDNGVGRGLADALIKDACLGCVSDKYTTTHANKEEILGKLEMGFRNGKLLISDNDVLIDEFSKFGVKVKKGKQTYESLGKTDDCVMSCAFAFEALNRGGAFSYAFI